MDQTEASENIAQITKQIRWIIPGTIRTDHATHLVVQRNGSEFLLLFFELQSPLLTGTQEEQLTAFREIPFAEAKCVSKIVMSAENAAIAAGGLIEGLNKLNAMLLAARGQENANTSLKPYLEIDRDLYARMPPKSSREVTIDVTVRGKAKPKASLD